MNRALLRQLRREWEADRPTDVAAMMTYYAVFALFPMLVFVVTIGLLVVPPAWIDEALASARFAMPREVSELLTDQVVRMERAASASFAIGSALIALWGASRGAASLMSALNDMYEKEETRSWFRRQLIAIGTTLVVAALLIVAIVLLALGPLTDDRLVPPLDVALDFVRWLAAGLLVMIVWALLYSWLPDTDAPLHIFTPGAAIGVVLWFGITQGFAFYLDRFARYEQTYGAVASVIVFLTWLWLSNLALLLGAEVNDVLAEIRTTALPLPSWPTARMLQLPPRNQGATTCRTRTRTRTASRTRDRVARTRARADREAWADPTRPTRVARSSGTRARVTRPAASRTAPTRIARRPVARAPARGSSARVRTARIAAAVPDRR